MAKDKKNDSKSTNPFNSMDLDPDIIYNDLAQGWRTPQNDSEKIWAEEGKRLLANGGYETYFN